MAKYTTPRFYAGDNIAMKIPSHEYSATVQFYRDVIGLPQIEETLPDIVFKFGDKRLWLDAVGHMSQAEIWLEIQTDDVKAAAEYLNQKDVIRCDKIESLPQGFEGFWITSPANIIHLVSGG
jgi:predicted enzyme related to lactoylglutathione lyase